MRMAKQVGKRSPRRSRPSYITPIIMMTLLLFVIGVVGMIFIHFNEVSRVVRESVEMSVILRDEVKEADIIQLQKKLEIEPYVRSAEYISKEAAKERWIAETGEDFGEMLDFNPLPASIVLRLSAQYVHPDSVENIRAALTQSHPTAIREIAIDRAQVAGLSRSVREVTFIMLAVTAALFIVVVVMMDSTIRLSMYSNRFLVKSMQLVGAQRKFITRPYVSRSIANGLLSAALAIALVVGLILWLQNRYTDLRELENLSLSALLFAGMIGLGILISWWSTHRAVTKYLKLKLDELY